MIVKTRIGKLEADIRQITEAVQQDGFTLLDIRVAHLLTLAKLPMCHRDPFDHLLIAQAITEDATFISEDRNTARYPVRTLTCSGTISSSPAEGRWSSRLGTDPKFNQFRIFARHRYNGIVSVSRKPEVNRAASPTATSNQAIAPRYSSIGATSPALATHAVYPSGRTSHTPSALTGGQRSGSNSFA